MIHYKKSELPIAIRDELTSRNFLIRNLRISSLHIYFNWGSFYLLLLGNAIL